MVVFLRGLILSSISSLGIGKPLAVCVVCAGCQGLFWWVFWGIPISVGVSLLSVLLSDFMTRVRMLGWLVMPGCLVVVWDVAGAFGVDYVWAEVRARHLGVLTMDGKRLPSPVRE